MKLPNLSIWTAIVVVAAIVGVIACVYWKVDPVAFGIYSGLVLALVANLEKLFPGPPPPPVGPSVLAAVGVFFLSTFVACTPMGRLVAVEDGLKLAACVTENQDQPLEVVLVRCAEESVSPADIERMLTKQQAATRKAVAARLRGASLSCGDGGVK
jgi:hypothetical protein